MADPNTLANDPAVATAATATVPRHVAITMDGNGRWAAKRNLPRSAGHRRGAQAAKDTVIAALELGIKYLTLYSFSSENWNRSTEEVDDLMGLLRYTMQREANDMNRRDVRLRVIGDRLRLPKDVLATVESMEAKTADNDKLTVIIALSYGARDEIAMAARLLAAKAADGSLDPSDINAELFGQYLYTKDIPDPDLFIRTGGEQRISNFLLWQSAYAEFVFIDDFWPDFDKSALIEAINVFRGRERRFGGRIG
jgi:undecaprenyl diphosphate synthase